MAELMFENRPSCSAEDLIAFIRAIRTREMRSNCNILPSAFRGMVEQGRAWIRIGTEAAVILCPDTENIARLHYYAKDASALTEVVALLPETEWRIVCDIVGKGEQTEHLAQELEQAGFRFYATFQRMMCADLQTDDSLDLSQVEFARPEDAEEILDIVHQEFDPMTARMPSVEVLRERIGAGEVLVVRKDGRIAGFTTFDSNQKRVALLDHVIVRPEYREEKIAKKILWYKWKNHNQSQYYILWINVLCVGPIRYHEKNGFQIDGMYDYILTV